MRKLIVPFIALGLLCFAVYHVVNAHQQGPEVKPPVDPARSPYGKAVAGSGIVEARTENIAVGSPLPGIVTKVFVKVGTEVETGAELFQLDDRALLAEQAHRRAALESARVQLRRLENQPRPEEKEIAEVRVREAEVNLADQKDQMTRARALVPRQAISEEEWERRRFAHQLAGELLARARADLKLLVSGAWEWDKAVAASNVKQAQAMLEQTETELKRLVVRALVGGQVLQVNVRPGEFVGTPAGQALVVLGDIQTRHVRVDIDENDIPRFRKDAASRAHPRGNPGKSYPLKFVRVEPYVIPKKSLTGESKERVDTRVLQVIYEIDSGSEVYVGQQVDVFVDGE